MLRVAAPGSPAFAAAGRLRGAGRGEFAVPVAAPESGGSVAAGAVAGPSGLLAIQDEGGGEPPPRRRRTPREAAAEGLDLLRALQRGLLGAAPLPLATLEAAAAAAEAMLRDGGAEARLCAPVALRLRVELAKRATRRPDLPGAA